MINFSITGSSCGIKLSYYDLMLRFLWNLCKLQTSTNCGSNLTNLLIHLSLVTQFLNFRDENNTFSVSQPRNSDSLNSSADGFPFFGLPRKRVHLRPSYIFSCAFFTTTAPSSPKDAPSFQKLRPLTLRPPYLHWARKKTCGEMIWK